MKFISQSYRNTRKDEINKSFGYVTKVDVKTSFNNNQSIFTVRNNYNKFIPCTRIRKCAKISDKRLMISTSGERLPLDVRMLTDNPMKLVKDNFKKNDKSRVEIDEDDSMDESGDNQDDETIGEEEDIIEEDFVNDKIVVVAQKSSKEKEQSEIEDRKQRESDAKFLFQRTHLEEMSNFEKMKRDRKESLEIKRVFQPLEPPPECDYMFSLQKTEGACELFDIPINFKEQKFKPSLITKKRKNSS